MSRTPIAAPETEGRTFDTDWSIANVAKLLRANASRGAWRQATTTGGSTESVNMYYLRTVSARHLPSGVSVIFMRLQQENCPCASLVPMVICRGMRKRPKCGSGRSLVKTGHR